MGQLTKNLVLSEIHNYWYLLIAVLIGGQIGNFLNLKILPTRILVLLSLLVYLFLLEWVLNYFFNMDLNFFKKIRVLDAGMGQELLSRGLISKGTLWSATSLIDKKYHQLVIDTHLSSINSGAEVILTNTFTTRRVRMEQNQVGPISFLNEKACELALKAKEISKKYFNCRWTSSSK